MKRVVLLLIGLMLIMLTQSAQSQLKIKEGDELFIKEASENLRLSPSGSIICQLPQGTKVYAIGEEGNWVAVHIVGYIWKKSLTDSRFNIPGYTVRALHILVKTEEEAKEIKQLLAQGADFKQLAKERSKGPTAEKGGDLGVVTKGDLLPELDKAISALNVGQVSEIIKTEIGYHIFKRTE